MLVFFEKFFRGLINRVKHDTDNIDIINYHNSKINAFSSFHYQRHNQRRLEHLASLHLIYLILVYWRSEQVSETIQVSF